MPLALCIAPFLAALIFGRKSLVSGLLVVFATGYGYGILRANVDSTWSYFSFDAAVIGLYLSQVSTFKQKFVTEEGRRLLHWVLVLILWPLILFFVPLQDPMIQAVGLRGNVFFLPMMLLGARLTRERVYTLALGVAALNIPALLLALAEYVWGIQMFYPRNVLTEVIYNSNDASALGAFRIPSSFINAHAYAGTMVVSLPFLLGAWVQPHRRRSHQVLLMAGIIAAVLGVFLSAVRTHFVVMIIALAAFILSTRVRPGLKLVFTVVLIGVGILVAQQDRLQRFETLRNTRFIQTRVHGSVNSTFWEAVKTYPFGNGLGGGGTSIPAFLQDRLHVTLLLENEYGRTVLETGVIGLAIWIAFIVWFLRRRRQWEREPWSVGRRVAWFTCVALFCQGLLGVGLLTSIPETMVFLLLVGWTAVPQNDQPVFRLLTFQRLLPRRRIHLAQPASSPSGARIS